MVICGLCQMPSADTAESTYIEFSRFPWFHQRLSRDLAVYYCIKLVVSTGCL
jgi:hypothetical protein